MKIDIIDYESCSAAGINLSALRTSLKQHKSGLIKNNLPGSDLDTWIGVVEQINGVDDLGQWQSRNNALAALGYEQGTIRHTVSALISKYGAARIGLVMGSSTSSIDRTEEAYTKLNSDNGLTEAFRQPTELGFIVR